jgi:hypothetical protein
VCSAAAVAMGLFAMARHEPADVAAQGGSIPLRGGSVQLPEQDASPQLFASPGGEIFRVWNRLRASEREGGGAVVVSASSDGRDWRPLTQVLPQGTGVSTMEGRLAANAAGEIALAYRWWRFSPKVKHIRVARSSDAGKTWSFPPTDLDQAGTGFEPQIAWGREKTLILTWSDERQRARTFQIYLRRSTDGGATWEPEVLISAPNPSGGDYDAAPRLTSDGQGRFRILWSSVRSARATLNLARSDDDGRTWSPPQQIGGNSYSVYAHSMSQAGPRLLVTLEDQKPGRSNRIYATTSKDGGATWSPVIEVDGLPATSRTGAVGPSSTLAPSGEAWVAWHDDRNGRSDVFAARSPDGGLTWGDPIRVDADAPGTAISRYPRIAMNSGGDVAIVWEDDRGGFEAVYGRVFSGGRWSDELRLGRALPAKVSGRAPRLIATRQGPFYVVWEAWDYNQGPSPLKSLEGTLVSVPKAAGS